MASLGDATSLLEVGLALNLVAPALFEAERRARTASLAPVVEDLSSLDPETIKRASHSGYFEQVALRLYPGLGYAGRYGRVLFVLSVAALALSVIGLLWAAEHPNQTVSITLVRIYVATVVVGLPLLYAALHLFLSWISGALVRRLVYNPDFRKQVADLVLTLVQVNDKSAMLNAKMDEVQRRMEEFRRESAQKLLDGRDAIAMMDAAIAQHPDRDKAPR